MNDAGAAQFARDQANQVATVIKNGLSESDAVEFEKALVERRSRRIIQSPDSLPTQSAHPAPGSAPPEQAQPQETPPQKESVPSPDIAEPAPPAEPTHQEEPRRTKVVDPVEAMGELPLPEVKRISKLSHADFSKILAQYERAYIEEILQRNEGNKMKAAKEMGISRAALYRIMKRLGID
jgi:DNA-binding NtrC family response regulator